MLRILLVAAGLTAGCAASRRPPRWEVTLNAGWSDKLNPQTTVTGGVTLRRPVPPPVAAADKGATW